MPYRDPGDVLIQSFIVTLFLILKILSEFNSSIDQLCYSFVLTLTLRNKIDWWILRWRQWLVWSMKLVSPTVCYLIWIYQIPSMSLLFFFCCLCASRLSCRTRSILFISLLFLSSSPNQDEQSVLCHISIYLPHYCTSFYLYLSWLFT